MRLETYQTPAGRPHSADDFDFDEALAEDSADLDFGDHPPARQEVRLNREAPLSPDELAAAVERIRAEQAALRAAEPGPRPLANVFEGVRGALHSGLSPEARARQYANMAPDRPHPVAPAAEPRQKAKRSTATASPPAPEAPRQTGKRRFGIMCAEAIADRNLSGIELRVLLALSMFAGESGHCYPSREAISEATGGLHPTKISEATKSLEKKGYIRKQGKGGFSKATRFIVDTRGNLPDSGTNEDFEETTLPDSATSTLPESGTRDLPESGTRKEKTIQKRPIKKNKSLSADEPHSKNLEATENQISAAANAPATAKPFVRSDREKTRLPTDWRLPDRWRIWAKNAFGLSENQITELGESFGDFWKAEPGRKASKTSPEWERSWSYWVRKNCAGKRGEGLQ